MGAIFPFVTVRDFSPNTHVNWQPLGAVQRITKVRDRVFVAQIAAAANPVRLSFLSPSCVRVQFSPVPGTDYDIDNSVSVVNRNLGQVQVTATETADSFRFDTGTMQVQIEKAPFRLLVFRQQ